MKAIKTIKRKITDLDKMKIEEQKKAVRAGYDMDIIPSDLATYGGEAKKLLADLQSRNERMFLMTFLVLNTADSKKELDNILLQASGIANKHNCTLIRLDYQQEQGFMTSLPLGKCLVPIQRSLTTSSTAIFVPFTTQELFQSGGEALYYGLNTLSSNLIMVDRKQLKNPNGLILGTPGSGKSFAAKREITNVFLITTDDIIVCDPEGEYFSLVQRLKGQVIKISPTSSQYINPMDINLNYSEDDSPLALKSDFILSLCELIVGGKEGLTPVEKSIIDRCVTLVYTEYLAKLKPYRTLAKAEKKSIQADVNVLYKKSLRDNPQAASNPISRFQQKRAIKKQYIAARYSKGTKTARTTATTAKSALKKGADTVSKTAAAITKNPKVLLILLALFLLIAVISSVVSSCSVMFQGAITNVVSTSYTSENEELIAANDDYTALETALQAQIDLIERDYPDYDEYRYDLATIGHDPHQLASYLTALLQYFTASEVQGELQRVFKKQYKLTLTETVEVRYRTETRTDSEGNSYTVEVPYDYYILNVKLTNNSINTVANSLLNAEQLQMYNVYLQTKGNKPLLFGGGSINGSPSTDLSGVEFVDGERQGNQNTVDIALSQVGNVGGQPYWSWYGFNSRVEWCACYVSWVLNQAGYSEPKFAACQSQGVPYFSANGRWATRGYKDIAPGDVIFFDWEGDVSSDHVGIVIGTDGSRVYTVEGNSGDACKIRDYDLNSSVIMGYGLMN